MSRSTLADAARQAWAEVAALATEPRDTIGEATRDADVAAATAEAECAEAAVRDRGIAIVDGLLLQARERLARAELGVRWNPMPNLKPDAGAIAQLRAQSAYARKQREGAWDEAGQRACDYEAKRLGAEADGLEGPWLRATAAHAEFEAASRAASDLTELRSIVGEYLR